MSPRKNEDRTGAVSDPNPPAAVVAADPSSLNFVTPTEFVDLPTKGKYYPETHPLHNQETVEIRYMTAKDEDILSSRTLLKKGLAVDRFLQNIIVNKSIRVEDLFIGDKNAVLVAARVTGFGATYETRITCPSCGEQSKHEVDLADLDTSYGEDLDEVTTTEHGTYLITLPTSGVEVEFRLLTGKDERHLVQLTENKRRKKLQEAPLTDQFKQFIVSLNSIEDRSQINAFISNMPTLDSTMLRIAYRKVVPNVDMTQYFVCSECSAEAELEVPFTAEFFWPKR
jgi:hypothetical protein